VSINLVLTAPCNFKVRLTWVDICRVCLARWEESAPCVAFVALAPGPAFISFPIRDDPPPIWSGVEMRRGDIILHGCGDRIYQRTSGAGRWGLISLAPKDLVDLSRALMHTELSLPPAATILRPPSKFVADLLRLHAQACRLAETNPDMIAHRQVARALAHDLLHALVNCLTADEAYPEAGSRQNHAKIMARFESVLASPDGAQGSMPEIAAATSVPERTLRRCCEEFLGISPGQYARLRRLNLSRAALRRADPTTARVAEIARHYGFSELGRFAAIYRAVFGETPSVTLQRAR
jgi:AraC-like DNA-binding protein